MSHLVGVWPASSPQILVHAMRAPLLLFSLRPFGNIPLRARTHTAVQLLPQKMSQIARDVYGFARTRRQNELFNARINCSPQS